MRQKLTSHDDGAPSVVEAAQTGKLVVPLATVTEMTDMHRRAVQLARGRDALHETLLQMSPNIDEYMNKLAVELGLQS